MRSKRFLLTGALLAVMAAAIVVVGTSDSPGLLGGSAEARTAVLTDAVLIPTGTGSEPAAPALLAGPERINFQGRLTDPGTGNAVANGSYNVNFSIFDDPDAGTELWTEAASVTVTSGLFTHVLGSANDLPVGLFYNVPRFLQIQVGTDLAMTPRLPFLSVPYAFHADLADLAADAADVNCIACVHQSDVEFNYAGSATQGGAASDLACTGCVSSTDIATGGVSNVDIADGTIAGTDIQDGSITTFDLQDSGILSADINSGAIQSTHIGNGQVGTTQLAANGVTADKVGFPYAGSATEGGAATDVACANCIVTGEIADGQVGTADVADNSLTATDVAINYAASSTEAGIASNSQLLDSIDSVSFLRSDVSDSFTSGTLTMGSPTTLHLANAGTFGGVRLSANGAEGSQLICFFEGVDPCGRYFQWEDPNNRFSLLGNLLVSGDIRSALTMSVGTLGAASADHVCRNSANGVLTSCSSSARYKDNISALPFDPENLLALRPVEFKWKESGEPGVGLVAEEVAELIPELVTYSDKGEIEGVRYDQLTVYLLELLKQHEKELSELRAGSGGSGAAPASSGAGFGIGDLALVLAAAVGAAAVISGGTALVVMRTVGRREGVAS